MDTAFRMQFERDLCQALQDLYDPPALGRSSLVELLGLQSEDDPAGALMRLLAQAIEGRKPGSDVPPHANAWRIYHILRQRYVEGLSQGEIAVGLALSTRQLRRLHRVALRALADSLWAHHHLAQRAATDHGPEPVIRREETAAEPVNPTREQEMRWLRESCPSEPASVPELIQSSLTLLAPLLHALDVQIDWGAPVRLPNVAVQVTSARHALLNVLTAAIRSVPSGQVRIGVEAGPGRVRMHIRPEPAARHTAPSDPQDSAENLEIAQHLIGLSGGSLELAPGDDGQCPRWLELTFPTVEEMTVLAVDDNADVLQLLERYLEGTRYHFCGLRDPRQTLACAMESAPRIIVLDLMLPGMDGWELLGRLREHPKTRHIPVIICTILPQEDLALAFGAADLIRKPVTRAAFLAALDRQAELLERGSG